MISLRQIKEQAEEPFEKDLKIPNPSNRRKRRIKTFKDANLYSQYVQEILDMRCWQAEKMGFPCLELDEIVQAIMGEKHSHVKKGSRQSIEWIYNHHSNTVLSGEDCNWTGSCTQWYKSKPVPWYTLREEDKWRVQQGKLNSLKSGIPYEAAEKLVQLRELKLFNAFSIIAPMDAWQSKRETSGCVLIGEMWVIPIGENKSGDEVNFFITSW